MKKHSLRSKLIFQYMVIVIVCMVVIPMATAELLDRQFRGFATSRLRQDELELTAFFAGLYVEKGSWDGLPPMLSGGDIMRWPMVMIEIVDNDGLEVRKYARMNNRGTFGEKHHRNYGHNELIVNSREILVNNIKIGEVRFYCLPFTSSPEGVFLRRFNRIMCFAVAVMLAVSVMIAVFMANRIGRPVLNAARRAQQISGGKYRIDEKMESDIIELQTLIESVDRLGESLEAQENLRKRLLSDIAHELRNPVTVIKAHLEAMEDGVWEPTPDRIRLTVGEVDRLSQLINEVSRLTSIEGAGHSLELENIDASALAEKVAQLFDPLYKSKGVALERNIEPGVMAVMDGAQIRQVMENLLSNALRYTDAGGSVKISLREDPESVTIESEDSGIGIAAEDLPYIFERFYRTDVSRTRTSGGIGIGLAIVKAIVDAHEGTITVESEPGKGSRFTVKIPKKSGAKRMVQL